jgi:hypothetical protein
MGRLVALMFRWPVDAFVTGMELILGGLQEFRAVFGEELAGRRDDPRAAVTAALANPDPGASEELNDGPEATGGPRWTGDILPRQESRPMAVDLGGDDVKNVSYWITFVKPDFVATLQTMKEETIDYPTDEASFGGLKLARFFEDFAHNGIPWPDAWTRRPGNDYPDVGSPLDRIPPRDERYIKFNLRLNWRQPLPDAEREKDKVDVLRDIRDALS